MKKSLGYSLSEVLISVFIATLIMTLLSQVYLHNKQLYKNSQKILATRMEVEWVSELLSDSLRRAGFTPCVGIEKLTTMDTRNPLEKMVAYHLLSSQDGLQVSRMSEFFSYVTEAMNPYVLKVALPFQMSERKVVLVADCYHAEVHEVERFERLPHATQIVLTKPLVYAYQKAFIGEWIEEQWRVQTNKRGMKSLYYQFGHKEELSAVIHTLHVRQRAQHQQLLDVMMRLSNGMTHQFSVAVRGL